MKTTETPACEMCSKLRALGDELAASLESAIKARARELLCDGVEFRADARIVEATKRLKAWRDFRGEHS